MLSELFYFIEDIAKAFKPLEEFASQHGKNISDFCSQYMYMGTDHDGVSWFKNIMDRSYIKLPK